MINIRFINSFLYVLSSIIYLKNTCQASESLVIQQDSVTSEQETSNQSRKRRFVEKNARVIRVSAQFPENKFPQQVHRLTVEEISDKNKPKLVGILDAQSTHQNGRFSINDQYSVDHQDFLSLTFQVEDQNGYALRKPLMTKTLQKASDDNPEQLSVLKSIRLNFSQDLNNQPFALMAKCYSRYDAESNITPPMLSPVIFAPQIGEIFLSSAMTIDCLNENAAQHIANIVKEKYLQQKCPININEVIKNLCTVSMIEITNFEDVKERVYKILNVNSCTNLYGPEHRCSSFGSLKDLQNSSLKKHFFGSFQNLQHSHSDLKFMAQRTHTQDH